MKQYVLILFGFLLLLSCNNKSKNNLMGEIKDCDSATIMYYNTAGNPRFFSMTKVKDMDSLAVITEDVNGKVISGKDSCTTQGKIFFYGKAEAVYPVYFSRDPACMTLSFIKTGEKYFTKMNKRAKSMLDRYQLSAKEPGRK